MRVRSPQRPSQIAEQTLGPACIKNTCAPLKTGAAQCVTSPDDTSERTPAQLQPTESGSYAVLDNLTQMHMHMPHANAYQVISAGPQRSSADQVRAQMTHRITGSRAAFTTAATAR